MLLAISLISMTQILCAMELGGFEIEVGAGSADDFATTDDFAATDDFAVADDFTVTESVQPETEANIGDITQSMEKDVSQTKTQEKSEGTSEGTLQTDVKEEVGDVIGTESIRESENEIEQVLLREAENEMELENEVLKEQEEIEMPWKCMKWEQCLRQVEKIELVLEKEGVVEILSFRVNGQEVLWKWENEKLIVELNRELDEAMVQILFLYEKESEIPIFVE